MLLKLINQGSWLFSCSCGSIGLFCEAHHGSLDIRVASSIELVQEALHGGGRCSDLLQHGQLFRAVLWNTLLHHGVSHGGHECLLGTCVHTIPAQEGGDL